MTPSPFHQPIESNQHNRENDVAGLIGQRLNAAAVSIQVASEAVKAGMAPVVDTDRYFKPTFQAGQLATQRTESGAQTMGKVLEFDANPQVTTAEEFLAEPTPDDAAAWELYVKSLAKPGKEIDDDIQKAA